MPHLVSLITYTKFTTRFPFQDTIPSFYKQLTHTSCFYSLFLSLLSRNGTQCLAAPKNECLQNVELYSVGKVVWVKKVLSE